MAVHDIDKGWRKMVRNVNKRPTDLTVGVHGADSGRHGEGGMTNVRLMHVHEFGKTIQHPGGTPFIMTKSGIRFLRKGSVGPGVRITKAHPIVIPERSVIRSTVDKKRRSYENMMAKLWGDITINKMTAPRAANLMGLKVQADMRSKMTRGPFAPNKPSTIRRKGSSKPLIDTRQLAKSLGYEVRAG